ncbi:MAG: AMP-binding protein, partial [Spirochaetaceae bacterium]|nr:AMP-binding protein [Spirochaetaceae bacterium]
MNARHADPFSPFLDWNDFGQFADDITSRFAERKAFRYRTRGEREFEEWSYARVGLEAKALAAFLRSRGLSAGDRVVIWSDNRPEWCVAYLGLVAAGFVAVPVDALIPEDDAARIYVAAEASAAIASVRHAERLAVALGQPLTIPLVVGTDGEPVADCARSVFSWAEAVAAGADGAAARYRAQTSETLASLIFTSGTTGKPKAVMLSHGGILANIAASIRALPVYPEDSFLLILPLHHTYPTTCAFLAPMAIGASNTICEKVVGKVIVDDARDSGTTVVIGVPLLFDKLAAAMAQGVAAKGPAVRALVGALRAIGRESLALGFHGPARVLLRSVRAGAGFGGVRFLVSGGGPLSGRTSRMFDEFGFDLVQGYGMSENGPLISVNPLQARDNRSVGLPVNRTEARIAAGGEAAAAGGADDGVGEIQVRSPSLMLGYWRDPEATAAAFTDDGWLRTGDLGRIDDRGYIFITGRIKSL